jgi:hypothetical protein
MLSHKMLRIIRYGNDKYYKGHNDGLLSGGLIGFALGMIVYRKR